MNLRSNMILTKVRLGEWDLTTDEDCDHSFLNEVVCADPHVDVNIEKSIPHNDYNPKEKTNDIALLRLEKKVVFNDFIKPICLPLESSEKVLDGVVMTVTGLI